MSTAIEMENEIEDEIGVEPERRRFTVEEFQRMGEAGIIAPDERVELIDGEVYEMTPVGPRHIWSVIYLNKYLVALAGDEMFVSPQSGVTIGERRQPYPDFAVLRLAPGKLPGQAPQSEDCVLLVEVADTSVGFDRRKKSRLYAEANIPEYWVLDLPRNHVVVHRRPRAGGYRDVVEYGIEASFTSPAFGGRTISAKDLLQTSGA
ncbi:Uma2 family endonuclease [Longimicrobium sp.]|uniref:Uma2 family endonuclease n=1 Tax=Longimicrobium sp. TaxID=2029185 RepID=UPI003B3BB809